MFYVHFKILYTWFFFKVLLLKLCPNVKYFITQVVFLFLFELILDYLTSMRKSCVICWTESNFCCMLSFSSIQSGTTRWHQKIEEHFLVILLTIIIFLSYSLFWKDFKIIPLFFVLALKLQFFLLFLWFLGGFAE